MILRRRSWVIAGRSESMASSTTGAFGFAFRRLLGAEMRFFLMYVLVPCMLPFFDVNLLIPFLLLLRGCAVEEEF